MNGSRIIQTTGWLGVLCARHSLAVILTVTAACVIWTIIYLVLLLWAVLANRGLGGPLAYPAGLLFCLAAGTMISLMFLFPATVFAEWIAPRYGFPVIAQIPISLVGLALLCAVVGGLLSAVGSHPSLQNALVDSGTLFFSYLVPLGLYWWVAQSGPLIVSLCQRVFFIIFRRSDSSVNRDI